MNEQLIQDLEKRAGFSHEAAIVLATKYLDVPASSMYNIAEEGTKEYLIEICKCNSGIPVTWEYVLNNYTVLELSKETFIIVDDKIDKVEKNSNKPAFNGQVFAFQYCCCTREGSWSTRSLHYSKEGAEKAMRDHKKAVLKRFKRLYGNDLSKFGKNEDWCVLSMEVLP